ncbi:alpha/beta fold hydrolase [Streptomyces massasporeus]|uniref:alpha/beta fold hydrolase n=1 Tax=Streptomyces massasporeus TaxID=67324 RepID=UPI0037ABF4A6
MCIDVPNQWVDAANGVSYTYRRYGDPATPPLVLLQHFRGNLDSWDPALIDVLAAARELIAFDSAGVGLSSGRTPRTVRESAVDALAFMDALELEQVDLLGHSTGGFVAQEIALIRPRAVRRLVLAATAPRGAPGIHGWSDDVLSHTHIDRFGAQDYLYTFFGHTENSQHSGLEFLGRHLERTSDRDMPVSRASREAQYDAVLEWGTLRHSALERLRTIGQPVLVATGDSDLVIPPRLSHLLAGLLPDARLHVYPDSGHGFLFQHHREFGADVLAFLGWEASGAPDEDFGRQGSAVSARDAP